MPLRVRLGLVFALGAAVLIAAVGVGFVLQLRASLDATIDAGLRSRADAVADEYAADGLRSLRLRRDGEPLQVLTADGRVLASSAALSDAPVLDAAQRAVVIARTGTGHDSLAFTEAVGDRRVRLLATPLPSPGVLLVVGTGTDISDTADDHVERGLLVLAPPAVLVAGLAAWWLAGEALRPVERMRRQIAEISDRNDDSHLAVPRTRDEIAALATTLNDLLDRLRAALANERGFIADAGHELRTPLATLRTELELARRPGRTEAELREAVGAAAVETERVIRLAEDLLLLARGQEEGSFLRPERVDLVVLATAAARAADVLGAARDVHVDVEAPDEMPLVGDPGRLRQALDNVLANAVRHSPDGAPVRVTVSADDPDRAAVTISDRGPGFPEDFLPHAFERFRRADTARTRADGGAGLGLAIIKTIVHAHQGQVRAANRPDGGADVQIVLPRGPASPSAPAVPEGAAAAATEP